MEEPQRRDADNTEAKEDSESDKRIWIHDDGSDDDDAPTKGDTGTDEEIEEPATPVREPGPPPPVAVGRRGNREHLLARLAAERPHLIPLIQRNESIRKAWAPR